MWILFSLSCLVILTGADIIGKRAVMLDNLAPLKLRISVFTVSFVIGLIMYISRFGESGLSPWEIAIKNPILLVSVILITISELLYLFCFRYIGMAVVEAISGLEGIIIFAGLLLINLISNKLPTVKEMLIPVRLLLILIVLIFTFLLPNIESIKSKKDIKATHSNEKHELVTGILITLLAVIINSSNSLIADIILGTDKVEVIDFIMTICFFSIVPLPFLFIATFIKSKKAKTSNKNFNKYSISYTILYILHFFLGFLATSIDAVRSEVIYLTYPVISILGAKIILKEKYSSKQNLCIWVITISTIAFCVIDYII